MISLLRVYVLKYDEETVCRPCTYFLNTNFIKEYILAREIDCGERAFLIIPSFFSDYNEESKIRLKYHKVGRSPKVDSLLIGFGC
jgi:hypothetical protein